MFHLISAALSHPSLRSLPIQPFTQPPQSNSTIRNSVSRFINIQTILCFSFLFIQICFNICCFILQMLCELWSKTSDSHVSSFILFHSLSVSVSGNQQQNKWHALFSWFVLSFFTKETNRKRPKTIDFLEFWTTLFLSIFFCIEWKNKFMC